jgi:hypothetical protein
VKQVAGNERRSGSTASGNILLVLC